MKAKPLRVLYLSFDVERQATGLMEEGAAWGPFEVIAPEDPLTLVEPDLDAKFDALVLQIDDRGSDASALDPRVLPWIHLYAADVPVLLVAPFADVSASLDYLRLGVQDWLRPEELLAGKLAPRLRVAVERKLRERDARKAYSTDLETGLPHQQQLVEHMSHLLALRERQPSPMAVLVFRIEGLASVEARYGREASNVLRRKVAVRLRAGVRASDVVASIGDDSYGVLLAAMLSPGDAKVVGEKLLLSLQAAFKVTSYDIWLAAALGVAIFPEDGSQPDVLLRRAVSRAASSPAVAKAGANHFLADGGSQAANDDE